MYNYILYMEDSPNRAAETVYKIKESVKKLNPFPNRHSKWSDTEYRFYLICGYCVFYQYDEETDTVKVDRIIYSRRNIDELL